MREVELALANQLFCLLNFEVVVVANHASLTVKGKEVFDGTHTLVDRLGDLLNGEAAVYVFFKQIQNFLDLQRDIHAVDLIVIAAALGKHVGVAVQADWTAVEIAAVLAAQICRYGFH